MRRMQACCRYDAWAAQHLSLSGYIDWAVKMAQDMLEVSLEVSGDTGLAAVTAAAAQRVIRAQQQATQGGHRPA